MPSLLDMPDLVMKNILKDMNFITTQTLRKVCRDVRCFIDDVRPDSKIWELSISTEDSNCIKIKIRYGKKKVKSMAYVRHKKGCTIGRHFLTKGKLLEKENFETRALKDLKLILIHQQTPLDKLCFECDSRFLEKFKKLILMERKHLLKVKHLDMMDVRQDTVMTILPHIDPKTLDTCSLRGNSTLMKLDRVAALNQWKNISSLEISNVSISSRSVQYLIHIPQVSIEMNIVKLRNIQLLTESFIRSDSKLHEFNIIYKELKNEEQVDDYLANWNRHWESEMKQTFYYRNPDSKDVISLCHTFENVIYGDGTPELIKLLSFSRSVPDN